ncbi:MAG TPA: hypothetical protein DD000_20815 [Cyanobacteria bacterium UBA11166]|nr:hypothetical protein [Cyanobacteria bacterium UBA11166]
MDDGVGLPFDEPSDLDGVSLATKFLTHVHWKRSRDGHVPHVHIKRLGIGIAPLNIASNRLTVRSWRSGLLWEQHFSRGIPQSPATVVEEGNGRGTKIEVFPDAEIFGEAKPRLGVIRAALFEAVHLYSGLKIEFHQERFHAHLGLQMLGFMLLNPLSLFTNPDPLPFHVTLRAENLFIEVAIFGEGLRKSIFSWVNGVITPDGGSHVEGLLQALKDVNWKPEIGLIHLVMLDPNFAGPMRTKLDVPQMRKAIRDALREPLREYRSACKI